MIPHNRPSLGVAEAKAADRVLASGWVAQGPEVEVFEREFCRFLEIEEGSAVAVSSGSAALYLVLRTLGAESRKTAAPAYSCRAIANAIQLAGSVPVWMDTQKGSPNVSSAGLGKASAHIAIVAHMFGQPCELSSSLAIIEDCSQALGARLGGRRVGTIGKAGVFSFGASKLITSGGQGGMIVSQDHSLTDYVRDLRDYDTPLDDKPRFNFQMTDLQAGIGRAQLARLPQFLQRRQQIYDFYQASGLPLIDGSCPDSEPVRYRAVVRVSDPKSSMMELAGMGFRAIIPVAESELLASVSTLPNAVNICRNSLSLPIFPELSDEAVEQIAQAVKKVC